MPDETSSQSVRKQASCGCSKGSEGYLNLVVVCNNVNLQEAKQSDDWGDQQRCAYWEEVIKMSTDHFRARVKNRLNKSRIVIQL